MFGLFVDRLLCHHEDDTKALLVIVKVFSEFLSFVHQLVFFVIIIIATVPLIVVLYFCWHKILRMFGFFSDLRSSDASCWRTKRWVWQQVRMLCSLPSSLLSPSPYFLSIWNDLSFVRVDYSTLVNTSLEGKCYKANDRIGKASDWSELAMAT